MKFKAEFEVDGSGNWSITLPADNDKHDVLALGPVIDGIKAFLQPTLGEAEVSSRMRSLHDASMPTVQDADAPIGLVPNDGEDLPDLIA